jgi:hypothetical protein
MYLRERPRRLTGRVDIDDAHLGGQRAGGKPGRGSENRVSFVAAVQTTNDGKPALVYFSQQPFTTQAIGTFAARSLMLPLSLVSDGLNCFEIGCRQRRARASSSSLLIRSLISHHRHFRHDLLCRYPAERRARLSL